ncbi:glycosyltransferase domain-containing protein [Sulfuricurvum sp.]|uniref:glycosyltransferase domain-containing protein n=1 Tax=Sulfuricurvum sp. TaxID=2025608 RepID=UPI003568007E
MDRKVVYTAVYGPHDYGPGFVRCKPSCECILFTDDRRLMLYLENRKSPFKAIYRDAPHPDPRRACRYFKTMPDVELKDYDVSLWVDGNTAFYKDPAVVIDSEMNGSNYKVYRHWNGIKDIFLEGNRCIRLDKATEEEIIPQLKEYGKTAYSNSDTIAACTYIMRRHNNSEVVEFGRKWWEEILKFSARDQVSWDFLKWKMNLKFDWIKTPRLSWVKIGPHNRRNLG